MSLSRAFPKRKDVFRKKEKNTSFKTSVSYLEGKNEGFSHVKSVMINVDESSQSQTARKEKPKRSTYSQLMTKLAKKSRKPLFKNGGITKSSARMESSNTSQARTKIKNAHDLYKKSYIPLKVDLSECKKTPKTGRQRSLTNSTCKRKETKFPAKKSLVTTPVKKLNQPVTARPKTSRSRGMNNKIQSSKTEQICMPPSKYSTVTKEEYFLHEGRKGNQEVERYEKMLKEVNNEFQATLKKNTELYEKAGNLEIKLRKSHEDLAKAKRSIDSSATTKSELKKSLEKERINFEKATQKFNRVIQEKNDEIRKLKSVKLDLENRLLQDQANNMQSTEAQKDLYTKITKLVNTVTDLDSQLGKREAHIDDLNVRNDSLIHEIKQYKQRESALEYKVGVLKSESSTLKAENDMLRERKLKAGVILKENLAEVESLKRELTLTHNNLKFCHKNEDQYKEENYDLRNRLQKAEREVLQYKDQLDTLQFEHNSLVSKLVALEDSIIKGLSDENLIRSKLSSLINTFRIGCSTSNFVTNMKSKKFLHERVRTEPTRFRSLTEEKQPNRSDFRSLSRKNTSSKQKIDPMTMKPAGKKSNNEVDYRVDSVEYLDRNRTRTLVDKTSLYETHRLNTSQSGKIQDSFLTSRSNFAENLGVITEKSLKELDRNYSSAMVSSRPSSVTTEIRNMWDFKKTDNIFELESHREKRIPNQDDLYIPKSTYAGEGKYSPFGDDEVDSLFRTYEERHKPYEWQISKAQIDLSREYQSNI
ncbi:unnamed protein product [Moneuplotes crassus]|uniref:Uncharacterized protein n=1 Tax=Euplotes crassus TaxID=5936 RepID=A0AAD2DAF1_EUPCR|nr:unnamed protein product [Moneuplotes crassus]